MIETTTRPRRFLAAALLTVLVLGSVGIAGSAAAEETGHSAPADAEAYVGANPADATATNASHTVTVTIGTNSAVVGQTLGDAGDELVVGYNASGAVNESAPALAGNVVERIDENGTVEQLSGRDAAALSENGDGDLVVSLNGSGTLGPVQAGDKLRVVVTGVDNTALANSTTVDVTVSDSDNGATSAAFDLELGSHDGAIVVDGGAGPTAWASFQQAIENGVAGADGATVTLPNATLNEVDRQPTLASTGPLNAEIGGAANLTVQGQSATTVVSSAAGEPARFILWNDQGVEGLTVDSVAFEGDDELAGPVAQVGVALQTAGDASITDARFGSFSAAAVSGQGNITIANSVVDNEMGGGFAVVVADGQTATITANDIDIDGSVLPVPDVFVPGGAPPLENLPVENGGIGVIGAGEASITGNTVDGAETNDSVGIGLFGALNADIADATIQETTIGVGTQTSGNVSVAGADISRTERGIVIDGTPASFTVAGNTVSSVGASTASIAANPVTRTADDAAHVVTLTVAEGSPLVGDSLGDAGDELELAYKSSDALANASVLGGTVERIDSAGQTQQITGLNTTVADGDLVVDLDGSGTLGPVQAGDKLRVVVTGIDNGELPVYTTTVNATATTDAGTATGTAVLELGAHDEAILVEGGAGPAAWDSFQQAIENGVAGADGATVTLPNTTLNEVDRQPTLAASGLLNAQIGDAANLTVQGEDDTTVVSSAAGQTRFILWNNEGAEGLTVDTVGFDGDDELAGPAAHLGVALQTTDGATVTNSAFEGFSTAALSGQGNLTLTNNTVDNEMGGGLAAVVGDGQTATIAGNDIDIDGSALPVPDIFVPGGAPPLENLPVENGGIGVLGAGEAVIANNSIDGAATNASVGIGVLGSLDADIRESTIANTTIGVGALTSGFVQPSGAETANGPMGGTSVTVTNVTVTDSETGIVLDGSSTVLSRNTILGTGTSTGIELRGGMQVRAASTSPGSEVAVLDNDLRNHDTGLAVRAGGGANYRIHFNDIRDNDVGVEVNTSSGWRVPVTFNDIVNNDIAVAVAGGDAANLGANYWGSPFGPDRPTAGNTITVGGDVVETNRDTSAVNYAPALSAPVETLAEGGDPLPTDEWILVDDPRNPFAVDDTAAATAVDNATVAVVFVPERTTPDLDDPANYPDLEVTNSSLEDSVAIDSDGARGSLAANELLRVNVSSEVAGDVGLAATSAGFPKADGGTEFISSQSVTQTFSQQPATLNVSVDPATIRADGQQRAVVTATLEDADGDRINQTGAPFAWATDGPTVDEQRDAATYNGQAQISLAADEGGEQITVEGGLLGTTLQLAVTIETIPRVTFDDQALGTRDGGPAVIVQNVNTAGEESAVVVTYKESGNRVVAGLTTGTFDDESVPVAIEDTGGFPGNHTAHVIPVANLSGQYQPGDTISMATRDAVADQDRARVFNAQLDIEDQLSKGPADELTIRTADLLDGAADDTEFAVVVHPTQEPQPVTTFTATASEGFITINGNSPTDGQIPFSGADINGTVRINGTIYSDGTWRSTSVEFPPINPGDIVDGIDQIPDDAEIDINITVPPIEGVYDPQAGLVTAPLTLQISVEASIFGQTLLDVEAAPSATLTTGQSGTVTGEATGLTTATPNATLVANDFPINATGNSLADDQLGLPSPAGSNWLQLGLNFTVADPSELDGLTRQEVTLIPDEALGQSANLTGANENVTVELDEPITESQDVVAMLHAGPSPAPLSTPPILAAAGDTLAPVIDPARVTVIPQIDVNGNGLNATDTTGDQLLNDVDGNGEFNILDVQVLFNNLDNPELQANAASFAFGGDAPGEVTVLDVQGLFNQLRAQSAA
jgi:hypothetical protein